MDKLQDCPFCGAKNTDGGFVPHIDDCYLILKWMAEPSKKRLAIAWNTRPGESALRARVAELEKRNAELEWELDIYVNH